MPEFIPKLPSIFGRHDGIPDGIEGSTIVRFGTIPGTDIDGGGLVIDYLPREAKGMKRAIFAMSEEGMWVHSVEDGDE